MRERWGSRLAENPDNESISKCLKVSQNNSKYLKMSQNISKKSENCARCLKVSQTILKCLKMSLIVSKYLKVCQNVLNSLKMSQTISKILNYLIMSQTIWNYLKMSQNVSNYLKMSQMSKNKSNYLKVSHWEVDWLEIKNLSFSQGVPESQHRHILELERAAWLRVPWRARQSSWRERKRRRWEMMRFRLWLFRLFWTQLEDFRISPRWIACILRQPKPSCLAFRACPGWSL